MDDKPPSEFERGNPVMWPAPGKGDNGETKMALGIYLGREGNLAAVLRFNRHEQRMMAMYVDARTLRHTPDTICNICGEDFPAEDLTEEAKQKADAAHKRDFGDVPPDARRVELCDKCAPYVYQLDAENSNCTCAFSRGTSLRCVCPWRRARGFPTEEKKSEG